MMSTIARDNKFAGVDPARNGRDSLRLVGTLLLLTRVLEQGARQASDDTLSLAELSVLGCVQRRTGLPSAIAREMRLDPGRVTRIIDRLVSLGYLERAADAADRRRCLIRLRPQGLRRLEEGRERLFTAMDDLLEGLTVEERTGLAQGLEAVRRLLDARAAG